jgi:putative transposase
MPDKFQNKYRIPSARASWWDYGKNAGYFVTICTQYRKHYFGEIVEMHMHLTPTGQSVYDCWNEIPKHFPYVLLDEFVVMPNHVHGIIIIDKPEIKNNNCNDDPTCNTTYDATPNTTHDEIRNTTHDEIRNTTIDEIHNTTNDGIRNTTNDGTVETQNFSSLLQHV